MYAKLLNNLEALKLEKMYSYVSKYLDAATQNETPLLEALIHLYK